MERILKLGKSWALILGLWVLVGGDLLRVVHFAHTAHEYCAAHGVVEHRADPDHSHPHSEPVPGDSQVPADEHEACFCFDGIASPSWVPALPKPQLWATQPACTVSRHSPAQLARERLYQDAPKHSPPSA